MSDFRRVLSALLYLQGQSIRNVVVSRLKRLKNPRYLLGALVGVGYIYFAIFRNTAFRSSKVPKDLPAVLGDVDFTDVWWSLSAMLLAGVVTVGWLLPGSRAVLQFTEAECAFLFPAPVTRRLLIHYKLLRSQLALMISALIFALIFRRGADAVGGWHYAVGWWLMLVNLNLHFTGASFTAERLAGIGVGVRLRRWLVGLGAVALVGGMVWWIRDHTELPNAADVAGFREMVAYLHRVLAQPPLGWLLVPFKWALGPMFAKGDGAFVLALLPALGLIVVQYLWVLHSDAAFEEASIDASRRLAERVAAIRGGKSAFYRPPTGLRSEPFRLAAGGPAAFAFLWKSLIGMGNFYRLRTWLIACAVLLAAGAWLRSDPARHKLLEIMSMMALPLNIGLLIGGPIMLLQQLVAMLRQLDLLKAAPVSGRQIMLGEMAALLLVLSFAQWLICVLFAQFMVLKLSDFGIGPAQWFGIAVALLVVVPLLMGLLLCVPVAGLMWFPAWAQSFGNRGGGIDMLGQRLLFMIGYLLVMLLAVLPATLLAGIVAWLSWLFIGPNTAAVLGVTVLAGVLLIEFVGAVQMLGDRLERFDIAGEGIRIG